MLYFNYYLTLTEMNVGISSFDTFLLFLDIENKKVTNQAEAEVVSSSSSVQLKIESDLVC